MLKNLYSKGESDLMKTKNGFYFLVCAAALIFCTMGSSSASDSWLKDPITGCAVWDSESETDVIISWSGGCRNGKATGPGGLTWYARGRLDGRFDGVLVDGKAQGGGTLSFWIDDGFARYKGQFLDSQMHGRGVLVMPDNSRAEGEFKHDALNGWVTYIDATGGAYTGEVKNNEAQGQGHQKTIDNEEYFGDFRLGKREGQGVLLLPNGDIYTGVFKNDLPDGQGRLQTVEGGSYEGPFMAGQPHGEGIYHTPGGDTAKGRSVEGKPDGKFVVTLKNGSTEEQIWKNGKQEKP
jgi:hypothetical protein